MHVVTPGTDYTPQSYRTLDYMAFYRRVRGRLESAVADLDAEISTYPEPCPQCDICPWLVLCDRQRRDDDHLCLVAGITRLQARELQAHDVTTLKSLGELPLPFPFKPGRGSRDGYHRVRGQSRIQLEGRVKAQPVYELLPVEAGHGLARLPEPSPGDVFFDFEGDPFVGEHGREYLFGYVSIDDSDDHYQSDWAFTEEEEKRAFEAFIDAMMARWKLFPGFHIYHYAPYEPAALKRLMGRYATREVELDRLLRAERFVDLYAVVKQGLRASVEKYSIKDLERFFGFERPTDLREANLQRHALERALEIGDLGSITDAMHDTVEAYNRDDCISTKRLRDWLEELRASVIAQGKTIARS